MRVYGRPSCFGMAALCCFFLAVFALILWGLFKLNEILFLW